MNNAQHILELDSLLEALRTEAESCGVPLPVASDWYGLLKQKLIPQLTGGLNSLVMVAAITGGTNTGKSVVFNHLAGENCSAVDFRAAGTKHPVCLVPKQAAAILQAQQSGIGEAAFSDFQIVEITNPEAALELTGENKLFWRVGEHIPDDLAVIDTPDIDSDQEANWLRAGYVRNASDVLIAVLTEQKYNDAAVRQFFREAAEAKKPVLLLFNMLELPDDLQYVSQWQTQFCRETGVEPIAVVVAPHDRESAQNLTLPFYTFIDGQLEAVDLYKTLTELHFDDIKTQTLEGAVKVLTDPKDGVPAFFDAVEQSSRQFAEALRTLDNIGKTRVAWTELPNQMLVDEVRLWWNQRRPNWSQNINFVYRKVGSGLVWSIGKAASSVTSLLPNSKEKTQRKGAAQTKTQIAEEAVASDFVNEILTQLKILSDTSNPVLKEELKFLTGGESREKLIRMSKSILGSMEPVSTEFRRMLDGRLMQWTQENPKVESWLRMLDNAATAARPLVTVTLILSGAAVGAHIVGPMVSDIAVTTLGGEAAIHAGSSGIGNSIAKLFSQIQADYVQSRSQRFATAFQKALQSEIKCRLQAGANVCQSETFAKCKAWLQE